MNQGRTLRRVQVQKSRWKFLSHCTHVERSMHKVKKIIHALSQNSQPSKRKGFLKKGEKTRALTICWWAIHPLHPNSQLSTNIYTAQGYSYGCNISAQILGHNLSLSELASVALLWFTIAELLLPFIFSLVRLTPYALHASFRWRVHSF